MSITLSELVVPLVLDDKDFAGKMLGAGGIVASVTAVIGTSIGQTITYGDTLDTLGDKFGMTADQASGYAQAVNDVGLSQDTFNSALVYNQKNLVDADGNLLKAGLAYDSLGISIYNADGSIKTQSQLLDEVAPKINAIADPTEKARILTELYGKKGLEMVDVLGKLQSEGGLAGYIAKAKEHGTAMSQSQIDGTIKLSQGLNDLKSRFEGVILTIGMALIPIFNTMLTAMQPIFAFISANINPILIVLSAVVIPVVVIAIYNLVAGLYATASAAIVAMAPFLPIIAVILLVIGVVVLLYEAWKNNWGGIQDKLQAVWAVLEPVFNSVKTWLADTLTAAITTLSGFWTNTLLPAITAAWSFFNDKILPIIQAVITIMATLGEIAITALAGFWENILLPAITTAYDFFNDKILPIIQTIASFMSDTFGPAVSSLGGMFSSLGEAISGIVSGALQWVLDKLANVQSIIDNFHLPSWLTPGSPTPFELGLRGIDAALGSLNETNLPEFSAKLKIGEEPDLNGITSQREGYSQDTIDYEKLASVLSRTMSTELQKVLL
jgi:hypothetical protein